jgi:hypothetical protein
MLFDDYMDIQEKLNSSRKSQLKDPVLHAALNYYSQQIYHENFYSLSDEVSSLYNYILKNYKRKE